MFDNVKKRKLLCASRRGSRSADRRRIFRHANSQAHIGRSADLLTELRIDSGATFHNLPICNPSTRDGSGFMYTNYSAATIHNGSSGLQREISGDVSRNKADQQCRQKISILARFERQM